MQILQGVKSLWYKAHQGKDGQIWVRAVRPSPWRNDLILLRWLLLKIALWSSNHNCHSILPIFQRNTKMDIQTNKHLLQQHLNTIPLLTFPLFLMLSSCSLTPDSWDQLKNNLHPSHTRSCVRFLRFFLFLLLFDMWEIYDFKWETDSCL